MRLDWVAVAARIRGLIRLTDGSDVAEIATRLKVGERSLRMSVDLAWPRPTVDVIAALVRVYGLDPSWVLTGEYNPATHRISLENNTEEISREMHLIIDESTRPPLSDQGRHPS